MTTNLWIFTVKGIFWPEEKLYVIPFHKYHFPSFVYRIIFFPFFSPQKEVTDVMNIVWKLHCWHLRDRKMGNVLVLFNNDLTESKTTNQAHRSTRDQFCFFFNIYYWRNMIFTYFPKTSHFKFRGLEFFFFFTVTILIFTHSHRDKAPL